MKNLMMDNQLENEMETRVTTSLRGGRRVEVAGLQALNLGFFGALERSCFCHSALPSPYLLYHHFSLIMNPESPQPPQ